jgi:Spy/CpxP family protein refolding chaperone
MLKQCLLILLAFSLITIAAPLAAAQSNDAPPNSQQPAEGNAGWHHGPPDPAQHTQELTKKLKLTPDQQTKVQAILESEHSQMESLRQDNSTPQQDRRAKMMDIRQNSNTQIRALLDSNQQKKWDEMQANRASGRHHHGDDQGPPPQ